MNENPTIDVNKVRPITRFIYTLGALPTSYLMSMTYEEQLTWLCNYIAQTLIPAINTNVEAVQELQQLYIDLQNYVNNYFDNLDVQEEIDNKLDDMVESGVLQEIITEYLQINGVLAFDTVADMKTATNLVNGSTCRTLGFYTLNDGGGANYKVRTITNEDIVNNMDIIPLNDNTLIAELILEETINPLQLGAKRDITFDSYDMIQRAINLGNVKFTKGNYMISDTLTVPNMRIIDGEMSTIYGGQNEFVFTMGEITGTNVTQQIFIKNFIINSENTECSGVCIYNAYLITLENIRCMRVSGENTKCFYVLNGFNLTIRNCSGYGSDYAEGQCGLFLDGADLGDVANETNTIVENCLFQNFDYGIKTNFHAGNVITFENNGFSHCKYAFYLDGNANPVAINNTRMEWRRTDTSTGYGFYIKSGVRCVINTLNAYDIPVVYYNESGIVVWDGVHNLSGETQSPQYRLIDHNDGRIINKADVRMESNVYVVGDGWTNIQNMINNTTIQNQTTNSITLPTFDNRIYKTTSSIFTIYGRKGSVAYIYTEESNIAMYGTGASSPTNLWANPVNLTPYHLYKVIAVENNKFIVED